VVKLSRRQFLTIAAIAGAAIAGGYLLDRELSSLFSKPTTPFSATTATYALQSKKFVEIKAFENNAFVASPLYTANGLLSLVQEIHAAVGNFNITKFIRAQCQANINPNETFSDWNGTLDTYLTAVQQASGGVIIPDGDMDPYFGEGDCSGQAKGQPNQSQYFQNTAGLLNLSAIRNSGLLHLESWDGWFNVEKDVNNSPVSQTDVESFFGALRNQGWQGFLTQANDGGVGGGSNGGSFANLDYGYASYIRVGLFSIQNSAPYLIPMQGLINSIWNSEPYLKGVLSAIESQQQNGQYGGYDFAIQQFSLGLTAQQQQAALESWASVQTANHYTVVYPVLVTLGGSDASSSGTWDAKGAGALSTIENLMKTYNV
jgi:hypothetical protein